MCLGAVGVCVDESVNVGVDGRQYFSFLNFYDLYLI